jgi:hypothetical protein
MPGSTEKMIRDELFDLENALWDELCRLFRNVDRWQLEGNSYDSKRAYFNAFDIDEDGEIRLSFLVVGFISAHEPGLGDLTKEDLTRARALAKRIRRLKNALPEAERRTRLQRRA